MSDSKQKYNTNEKKTWRCGLCSTEFHTFPARWNMVWCKGCGKTAVDHDSLYIRMLGYVKEIRNKK